MEYFLRDYDSEGEEKLQLQRELKWLISEELPDILESIHLATGSFLQKSFWGGPVDGDAADQKYVLYHDDNPNVKGTISVRNCSVDYMELIAQMRVFNQKHLFRLTLAERRPYQLKQVLVAKSILLKIMGLSQKPSFISQDDAFEHLQKLISLLSDCSSILLNGSPQDLFPNKICDGKAFEPNLPEELALQLSLDNGAIAIDLINIASASSNGGSSRSFSSSLLKKAATSERPVYQYGSRDVHIVDHITVSAQCPEIREVVDASNVALTRLNIFVQNLQVIC